MYHAGSFSNYIRPMPTSRLRVPLPSHPAERLFILGSLTYLLLFAWRFRAERLHTDSGYYLAQVIADHGFHIEHGRWALALAQMLPLAGVCLGTSLGWLVLLHSLNSVLWAVALVAFAWFALRNRTAALLLAAVHLLGLTHGLFCPVFELYYGVDLLILSVALAQDQHLRPSVRWVLAGACWAIGINSHFLGLGLGVALLSMVAVPRKRTIMMAASGIAVLVLAYKFVSLSSYESERLLVLQDLADPAKVLALFSASRLGELSGYLLVHYADMTVLALLLLFVLVRERQWKPILAWLAWGVLFHVLAGSIKPGTYHDRYLEQVNFVQGAWTLIIGGHLLLALPRYRRWMLIFLLVAGAYRMAMDERVAPYYQARTAHIEGLIERAHERGMGKGIALAPRYFGTEQDIVQLDWSLSVESLLLSARRGPQAAVSIITTEDVAYGDNAAHLNDLIFRRWEVLDTSWLAPRYFRAPQGTYTALESL